MRAIERAMNEYAVCVLPSQILEDDRQIAFSRLYGPLASPSINIARGTRIQQMDGSRQSPALPVPRSGHLEDATVAAIAL
jgi:hypothetical protein